MKKDIESDKPLTFVIEGKVVGEKEYREWLESFFPDSHGIDMMVDKLKKVKEDQNNNE